MKYNSFLNSFICRTVVNHSPSMRHSALLVAVRSHMFSSKLEESARDPNVAVAFPQFSFTDISIRHLFSRWPSSPECIVWKSLFHILTAQRVWTQRHNLCFSKTNWEQSGYWKKKMWHELILKENTCKHQGWTSVIDGLCVAQHSFTFLPPPPASATTGMESIVAAESLVLLFHILDPGGRYILLFLHSLQRNCGTVPENSSRLTLATYVYISIHDSQSL
jgi:hypothetical protein